MSPQANPSASRRLLLPLAACFAATVASAALPGQVPNRRASSDSGQNAANDDSLTRPHVSATGRYVVFSSDASNLVPGDTNGWHDVFVKDFGTGLTDRLSLGPNGAQGNDRSSEPRITSDGRWVVYSSRATTLSPFDQNHLSDVYVADRIAQTTTLVSTNHLGVVGADGASFRPSISDDGRYVAFASQATNLIPGGDANGFTDVYVKDTLTGATRLCSRNAQGQPANGHSRNPRISRSGQFVVFDSEADDLVANDGNGRRDVFVFDLTTDAVWRSSLGPNGAEPDGDCTALDIDAFGQHVLFESFASNLVAGQSGLDVYVSDAIGSFVECVNVDSGGTIGNGASLSGALSGDGRFVAFTTRASDLFAGDGNGSLEDVAVRDRVALTTERASIALDGGSPNGACRWPSISDDGRFVAYVSAAPNLLFGKTDLVDDVIRADVNPPVTATAAIGGPGCPGTAGLSALQNAPGSLPWIGFDLHLVGDHVPAWFGVLFVGTSNALYQGLPLPLPLDAVGMPGCTLYTSAELSLVVVADAMGDYAAAVPIPDDANLRGLELFAQSFLFDPGANAFGGVLSNGLDLVIGG